MAPPPETLLPVYATFGEDRPKVERTVARLVQRMRADGAMEPERMNARETPIEDVVVACQALSFGGSRAVIVENADAWKATEVEPVLSYLEDPNPSNILLLVSAGPVTQKLLHAVERTGKVLQWGPDPRAKPKERRQWLETHFGEEVARLGGRVGPRVVRHVVDRVLNATVDQKHPGVSATTLSAEAEKLVAYAGGAAIDQEMVEAVVPVHPDAKVYELADAVTTGRSSAAFTILQELAGGDDKAAPEMVQAGLLRHFRALAAVQELGPGASPEAVTKVTGIAGFPARKVAEQAVSLPAEAGARAFVRLARLELDLRVSAEAQLGTSPDDGKRFVLERAVRDVLRITGGRAKG